jgi:predicted enzyme related to lactoylglutathione lyase
MNYVAKTLSPVLPVADMDRAVAFFRDVLGFTPAVESTHYTLIRRDGATVHLTKATDAEVMRGVRGHLAIYLEVQGIEELWAHVQGFRAKYRMRDLFDRDYDMREFHIEDPDGCLIQVGEAIA